MRKPVEEDQNCNIYMEMKSFQELKNLSFDREAWRAVPIKILKIQKKKPIVIHYNCLSVMYLKKANFIKKKFLKRRRRRL